MPTMSESAKSSGSSDEFAYQTRLVVYNFLGLVPATPTTQSDDEQDSFEHEQSPPASTHSGKTSPWKDTLVDLPTESLIERLTESEKQQMNLKSVCREVVEKVERFEPDGCRSRVSDGPTTVSDGPTRVNDDPTRINNGLTMVNNGPTRVNDGPTRVNDGPSKEMQHKRKRSDKLDLREAQLAVLAELKQREPFSRGRSPNDSSNDDQLMTGPITIIKKKNRVKVLRELNQETLENVHRSMSFQPHAYASSAAAVLRPPEVPSQAHRYSLPNYASSVVIQTGVGFRGAAPEPNRPTTLPCSTPSRDTPKELTQIDEEEGRGDSATSSSPPSSALTMQGENQSSNGRLFLSSVDHNPALPHRQQSVLTPASVERQSSTRSESSHRCYIDITEMDIASLKRVKAMPPSLLPLKRELSLAFEELERSHGSGHSGRDEIDGRKNVASGGGDVRTPESEVADSLRALGDRVQEEYGSRLNSIVQQVVGSRGFGASSFDYEAMQLVTEHLLRQTENGWTRVALVMVLGQQLIYEMLRRGCSGIGQVAEYTAKLVENHAAGFIINNGGWNSISEIGYVETPVSFSDVEFQLMCENCSTDVAAAFDVTDAAAIPDCSDESNPDPPPPPLENADHVIVETRDDDHSEKMEDEKKTNVKDCTASSSHETDVVSSSASRNNNASEWQDADATEARAADNLTGDILLLRQNSQQYVDERESARRTSSFALSGTFVGFVIVALLATWFAYRRVRN